MNNENPELKPVGEVSPSTSVPTGITFATTPTTAAPAAVTSATQTRYNPVTGQDMNMTELLGKKEEAVDAGAVNNEEKLKTVDVEYKPPSTANTVMPIIFFIAIIAFVIFLPDIQSLIAQYKAGPVQVEEIKTGKLVCTLSSNTVNLDHEITREFEYVDEKLQSAKFTTVIRGDATIDEETLDEYNAQCKQIRENLDGLTGVSLNCEYENGKVTEKESFDYSTYNIEDVTAAYSEAGGSVLEFEFEQDINSVMTNMRQGGFTCNKEK